MESGFTRTKKIDRQSPDIYAQYEAVANYFEEIPDYITVVVSPGDHDAVLKSITWPSNPQRICSQII